MLICTLQTGSRDSLQAGIGKQAYVLVYLLVAAWQPNVDWMAETEVWEPGRQELQEGTKQKERGHLSAAQLQRSRQLDMKQVAQCESLATRQAATCMIGNFPCLTARRWQRPTFEC